MKQVPFSTKELIHSNEEKTYVCEYRYQGSDWCFEVKANSLKEAEYRLKCISQGNVLGELEDVIPYEFGWMAKVWVWLANALRKIREA